MKKFKSTGLLLMTAIISGLIICNFQAKAQQSAIPGAPLPEDVNKIVTFSCTPCHTSQGGLMSRSKLNLTEWTKYSAEVQKAKAKKMYSEISKGAMPPKMAREKRPETIPTNEQKDIIKKWVDSFSASVK